MQIDTDEINAGAYLLERSVLDQIPPDSAVSIEREVFPRLVGDGLYGIRLEGYWIDIGTPERFLEANWDILEGRVETGGRASDDPAMGRRTATSARPGGAAGAAVRRRAPRSRIGSDALIERSVLLEGCVVEDGARVVSSILSGGVTVEPGAELEGAVIGEDERVAAGRSRGMTVVGGDMLDAVRAIPDHLRDALWRIETARAATMEAPAAFVCGMGGSAIGGDLAVAALSDRLTKPMITARGYELPSWAPAGSAVLCSSYSGNTEETLACYAAAEALGAHRLVATTGGELAELARADDVPVIGLPAGLQPRAAVGYMFCVAAELAALALAGPGSTPRSTPQPPCSAGPSKPRRTAPRELAAEIGDATPVIYGGGLTAPVAYRWGTQINENAKVPAFSGVLPEADHNQLEGWSGAEEGFAAIFLEDRDQHPRERKRFELTSKAIESSAAAVIEIETEGETPYRARPAHGDAGRPARDRAGEHARRGPACRRPP